MRWWIGQRRNECLFDNILQESGLQKMDTLKLFENLYQIIIFELQLKRTMQNSLKNLFIILFTLILPNTSEASHAMGGDISYKWLGGKKYEFTFNIYRDCRGIPLDSIRFRIFNSDNTTNLHLKATRTSIVDITVLCNDTLPKKCYPANSTSNEGVEKHIYSVTVDLESQIYDNLLDNQNCEIFVSADICCRNGAITTIVPGNFYIQSMINVCNSKFKNSSPVFVLPGSFKTGCNVPFTGNLGGTDIYDGDSLTYELVAPLNAYNSNESYTGSFTPSIPMTPYCVTPGFITCAPSPNSKPPRGFSFNKRTGEIVYVPAKCDEVGVIVLKISEFRKINGKWVNLGYVMRDIQITLTSQTMNEPPKLTANSTYNFKLRKKTCFDIKSTDLKVNPNATSNFGDSTRIHLVNPMPGMTMSYLDTNAKNKTARVCWTPPDSILIQAKNLSKQILLIAEVFDNYCPYPALTRKSILLNILPPDSFGYLNILTYEDANKNKKLNINENTLQSQIYIESNQSNFAIHTDEDGEYKGILPVDTFKIGTQVYPYYENIQLDTILKIKDSAYHFLEFPRYLKKGIHGQVYHDLNANCLFDGNDIPVEGVKIFTDSGRMMSVSDREGKYYLNVAKGKTYQITAEIANYAYTVSCPTGKTYTINYSKDSTVTNYNFAITDNPDYFNIKTNFSIQTLRRGTASNIDLRCSNLGNKTAYNINLSFTIPNGIALFNGSTQISVGPDTLEVSIDSLISSSSFIKKLFIIADPNTYSNGDLVCFKIWTDSINLLKDSVKGNNNYNSCIRVSAPHDPNYKYSSNEFVTPLDKTIDYNVYFQNTGNDTAFRVVVTDTIKSPYLDLSKFELNWSGAPCVTYIAGNVIYFEFSNIKLPQLSIAGEKSINGFGFKLGLKDIKNTQQSIRNRVGIYFDFESEVLTENAITTVKSPIEISNRNDSIICHNRKKIIEFKSNVSITNKDFYLIEISDKNGSFSSPALSHKKPSLKVNDTFHLNIKNNIAGKRKIRINLLKSNGTGIETTGSSWFQLDSIPVYTMSNNLKNGKLCDRDTLKISFVGNNNLYKLVRNLNYSGTYSSNINLSSPIKTGDNFKTIINRKNSGCYDTLPIALSVLPLPKVGISIKDLKNTYCENDSIILQSNGGIKYRFHNLPLALNSLDTISRFITKMKVSNKFYALGEDINGCKNYSDTIAINAYPSPVKPTITAFKNFLSITYQPSIVWYRDGNVLSDTGSSIKKAASGAYKVKVSNQYGCYTYSDVYNHIYDLLSIKDIFTSDSLTIFPNPASSTITIETTEKSNHTVYLYDLQGKLLQLAKLNNGYLEMNLQSYSSGIYIIALGSKYYKIVKE